jgi:flagellar protein FlgJ
MHARTVRLAFLLVLVALWGTPPVRAEGTFLELAIPLAQKSQRETTVPASITLAQAMWETGRGDHPIGSANNFFGIKAAGTTDESVNVGPLATGWVWAWTREWNGTRYESRRERFRKYNSMEDSFRDHGLLLATAPRYALAMQVVDDPREFARRIAAAGYATSPTYAQDLIRLMDAEDLYRYDIPRNAMERVSQSAPLEVGAGDIFQIYFDLKNTGFGTWSPAAGYHLARTDGELFGASERQELERLVQPERVQRWAITMIAPQQEGTYTTAWQLQHGSRSVGEPMRVQVRVVPAGGFRMDLIAGAALALGGIGATAAGWFGYQRQKKFRALCRKERGILPRRGGR